jgi:hypothetical protein
MLNFKKSDLWINARDPQFLFMNLSQGGAKITWKKYGGNFSGRFFAIQDSKNHRYYRF